MLLLVLLLLPCCREALSMRLTKALGKQPSRAEPSMTYFKISPPLSLFTFLSLPPSLGVFSFVIDLKFTSASGKMREMKSVRAFRRCACRHEIHLPKGNTHSPIGLSLCWLTQTHTRRLLNTHTHIHMPAPPHSTYKSKPQMFA